MNSCGLKRLLYRRGRMEGVFFNTDFENAHRLLLERHLNLRTGERKGRLLRGHQYAEKLLLKNVWWPLFGNLEHLHPEYEVYDLNRKLQFPDGHFSCFWTGWIDKVKISVFDTIIS